MVFEHCKRKNTAQKKIAKSLLGATRVPQGPDLQLSARRRWENRKKKKNQPPKSCGMVWEAREAQRDLSSRRSGGGRGSCSGRALPSATVPWVCPRQIKAPQNKQKKTLSHLTKAFLSLPTLEIKQTEPTEPRPPSAAASMQEKKSKTTFPRRFY